MPLTLTDLMQDERTFTLTYLDEELEVTYRPSGYTPEVEDRFQSKIEANRSSNSFAEFLAGILVKWNLESEDGSPYPTDVSALRKLPSRFLSRVVSEITTDMQSEMEERKNSGAGSLAKRNRSDRARPGTR